MRNVSAIAQHFSNAAQSYDAEATLQLRVLRELIAALQSLPAEALVLDAGCGTGLLATLIPQHTIGIDLAFGMCKQASARMPVACADMASLPLAQAYVDAVVSNFALQWVAQPYLAFKEFARVLKPAGVLLASSFGPATLQELDALGLATYALPSFEALCSAAEKAGFTLQRAHATLYQEPFPTTLALMRHLRAIGANAPQASAKRITKTQALRPIIASFEVITLQALHTA